MKKQDHIRNFNESFEVIKECIEKGIIDRQRTIGFSVSAASIDLLEAFLHQKQLLNPSSILKHDWFTSVRRVNERLNFDFPEKVKITNLIIEIEEKRNIFCYGKPKPEEEIEAILEKFYELIDILKKLGLNLGEKNE